MKRHASFSSTEPLYAALADSVQGLISAGTFRPGHRIPSVRRMAQARTVSISTVLQAYTLLESRGYLEARLQSGYYVRPRLPFETPEPRMARPMARPSTVGISDLAAAFMRASSDPAYVPLGGACPDPSLFPTAKLARLLGAAGRDGLCLDSFRSALAQCDIKAVLVMPGFQNPLGSCMPDENKERLYNLLVEHDVAAVEDDIYGDLHFEERRPKPLKAWDTDGRVLLCSSFGKTLAAGARVGWVAPGRYTERVRRLKLANTLGTPVVLQKTISDFLRNGGYDHHLRSIRRAYRHQVQVFSQAIVESFPSGTRLSRPQGGFILWLELPTGVDTVRLHEDALTHHINTAPGVLFSVKDRYRHCLRMNCGLPWSPRIEAALRTLGRLASAQLGEPASRRHSA